MAGQIQKAGDVTLLLNTDGRTIGSVKARAIEHEYGISFLGAVDLAMLNKLVAANKKIVMPRQNGKKLDHTIKFSIAELNKHIIPVIEGYKKREAPEVRLGG